MKAIIIGCGIAGPAAAVALRRAKVAVSIFEAYPRPADEVGWFLNFATNGQDALAAAGVDIASVGGYPIPTLVFHNGRGRRLGQVANGTRLTSGAVSMCVRRGALQRLLREAATEAGASLAFGKRLVGIEQHEQHVTALFDDSSRVTADVLIAADGIASTVRQLLDPGAPPPSYTGMVSVGGYSRVDGLAPTHGEQVFIFGKRAFFGYLVGDDHEVWWFANVAHPEASAAELAAIGIEEWRSQLGELFKSDLTLITDILQNATEIGAHPIHDHPTTPKWHRDRVVLIGDAAHATSPSAGQGAAIACEDAVVLAQCVRDAADIPEAFDTFEWLRRERVEKVVAYARQRGSNKTSSNALSRLARDLVLPIVLRVTASEKAHEWLYGHHVDWDTDVSRSEARRHQAAR